MASSQSQSQSQSQKRKKQGSSSGGQRKKQPGRGMGVAQLERIRLQVDPCRSLPLPNSMIQQGVGPTTEFGLPSYAINPTLDPVHPHRFFTPVSGFQLPNLLPSIPPNLNYCFCTHDFHYCKGAQVLAVHRKGGIRGEKKLVMEYGFFPTNSTSSMAANSSSDNYGYPSAASIDLSLRL